MEKWIGAITAIVLLTGGGFWWLGNEIDKGTTPVADGTNDYMIILGAKINPNGSPSLSLQNRLDVAVDYLLTYEHVDVIVSGGQGNDEPATEASVMAKYLIEHGVDASRILLEEASTSTYENFLFSKKLLPEDVTSLTVVSNDFHLKRAKYLARVVGYEVDLLAAPTPEVVEAKSRFRERLALLKTYVVGK